MTRPALVLCALSVLVAAWFARRQYFQVRNNAVDIPYMDEWETVNPGAVGEMSWDWLFAQHNEHRIVFTKLQAWAHYELDGWNNIEFVRTSYVAYLALVVVVVAFGSQLAGQGLALLALPFFSSLNWENVVTGFQGQFHHFLLFFLLAVWLRTRGRNVAPLAFVWCSVYSLAAGIFCGLAYVALNLALALLFREERRRGAVHALAAAGIVGYWLATFHKHAGHPGYVWPWEPAFWEFFLNILGLGFGHRSFGLSAGIGVVLVLGGGILWLAVRERRRHPERRLFDQPLTEAWRGLLAMAAVSLGIAMALGSVTLGRTNFGLDQSKTSRYSEIGMILIPIAAAVLIRLAAPWAEKHKAKAAPLLVALAVQLVLLWSFRGKLGDDPHYAEAHALRIAGHDCVRDYYAAPPADPEAKVYCVPIYPFNLRPKLDHARQIQASFARRLAP